MSEHKSTEASVSIKPSANGSSGSSNHSSAQHSSSSPASAAQLNNTCLRVALKDFEPDLFLTQSYCSTQTDTLTAHPYSPIPTKSDLSESQSNRFLVIRHVLHRSRIVTVLVLLLLLSPCAGAVVYVSVRQVDAAVAASAAIYALASLLQGLAVWIHG